MSPSNQNISSPQTADKRPPWLSIYRTLKSEILAKAMAEGGRLPSEKQLCERFSVTRMTVRRALEALQREGLVTARKGSGVYINTKPTCYEINSGRRFIENVATHGHSVETKTLSISRVSAKADLAEKLDVKRGTRLIAIKRIRIIGSKPAFLNFKWMPAKRFPKFDKVYEKNQSVSQVYSEHGIKDYHRIETRVSGGRASEDEAQHLLLEVGTPVFRSQSVNSDNEGKRIEFSQGSWPLDSVEFIFPRD